MARVTVEDCLKHVRNHFALTILAAERARQLAQGAESTVEAENRQAVTALREIAEGNVAFAEPVKQALDQYLYRMRTRGLRFMENPQAIRVTIP